MSRGTEVLAGDMGGDVHAATWDCVQTRYKVLSRSGTL